MTEGVQVGLQCLYTGAICMFGVGVGVGLGWSIPLFIHRWAYLLCENAFICFTDALYYFADAFLVGS